jgi:hypothetical protein
VHGGKADGEGAVKRCPKCDAWAKGFEIACSYLTAEQCLEVAAKLGEIAVQSAITQGTGSFFPPGAGNEGPHTSEPTNPKSEGENSAS